MQNSESNPTNEPYQSRRASLLLAARDAADKSMLQHIELCPFQKQKIEERVRCLETRFALLSGFMFGSGIIGGAAGAWVFKALGG